MLYIYILFLHTMYVVFLGARPTCLKQVLDKSMELRTAVTMRRDFVQLLPEGTKFFHPLCLGASGSLSWALNQPAHPGRDLRPRDARYPVLPFWLDGTEPLTLQNLGFLWKMWKSAFVFSCFISSILFPLGAQEWLLHASPVKMNVVSQGETRTWWVIEASEYRKFFSIRRFRLLLGCRERLFKDFIVLCLLSFLSRYVMQVCSHSSCRAFVRKARIRYCSSWHARPGLAADLGFRERKREKSSTSAFLLVLGNIVPPSPSTP